MSVWVFTIVFLSQNFVFETTVRDFPDEMTCKMFGQNAIMQTMMQGGVVAAVDCVEEKSS